MLLARRHVTAGIAALSLLVGSSASALNLTFLGRYSNGLYDQAACETVAFDPATDRAFTTNSGGRRVDAINLANPLVPTLAFSIALGAPYDAAPNHVAFRNGIIAVACETSSNPQAPGKVLFFDANGLFLNQVTVGPMPDMCTFTPDGQRLLVANEGEPNNAYTNDPEGSISVIDMSGGALAASVIATLGFTDFNVGGPRNAEITPAIRIYGPGATVAKDLEPEYITVSGDSKTAWVSLQEANAFAILDLQTLTITSIVPLGLKNHALLGNQFDASDRDNLINIANWPVYGMYQPDGITRFTVAGQEYILTANEGDSRGYTGLNEEVRVGAGAYVLDPTAFPNAATLKLLPNLGRLTVTNKSGDTDGDGDFDQIHLLGARSFSIRSTTGALLWDSGNDLETRMAGLYAANFNASNTNNTFDDRSDNKGPEPEGCTVADLGGSTYAFIGLERQGGVMVYDVSNPLGPVFVQHVISRNYGVATNLAGAGDLAPEVMMVVQAADSPTGLPLLLVANEISGSLAVYSVELPVAVTASLMQADAFEDRVELAWQLGTSSGSVVGIERREQGAFELRGTVYADGNGRVAFVDTEVTPGARYTYRLTRDGDTGPEVEVLVPQGVEFSVQTVRPSPARGAFDARFTLARSSDVSLELVDAMGRRVWSEEKTGLSVGVHSMRVDTHGLKAGLYFLRVRNGDVMKTTRVVYAP